MKEKGLCVNCRQEEGCAFPRKFPVWECNEHSTEEITPRDIKKSKKKAKK
ncbi:MAG: hypothetical protein PHU64_05250 [Candidatus Omnitrophica bacterium]|nr:hypothetical protein [Candidatus Omnitrophota bacterium]MDD5429859.1 hypothetical protein [Candidatus Omnitrophota bacterium]